MWKILIFLLCPVSRTQPFLFIFWGSPSDSDECSTVSVGDFESCTNNCLDSESCMLAFGNDDSCQLCDLYTVTTINQSDISGGVKTAVKVDEPSDGCPTSMLTNQYTRTDIFGGYNLTYSGGIWTIDGPRCQTGFTMFNRSTGFFCLRVFFAEASISRYSGTSECQVYLSTSAGFDSIEEKEFIMSTARSFVGSRPEYLYTPIWLGGGRRPACNKAGSELKSDCAGIKMFENMAYQVNYEELYIFASGYPTTEADNGSSQNCLGLLMGQANTTGDGQIFNAACGNSCNQKNTICGFSYVCGNPAL